MDLIINVNIAIILGCLILIFKYFILKTKKVQLLNIIVAMKNILKQTAQNVILISIVYLNQTRLLQSAFVILAILMMDKIMNYAKNAIIHGKIYIIIFLI